MKTWRTGWGGGDGGGAGRTNTRLFRTGRPRGQAQGPRLVGSARVVTGSREPRDHPEHEEQEQKAGRRAGSARPPRAQVAGKQEGGGTRDAEEPGCFCPKGRGLHKAKAASARLLQMSLRPPCRTSAEECESGPRPAREASRYLKTHLERSRTFRDSSRSSVWFRSCFCQRAGSGSFNSSGGRSAVRSVDLPRSTPRLPRSAGRAGALRGAGRPPDTLLKESGAALPLIGCLAATWNLSPALFKWSGEGTQCSLACDGISTGRLIPATAATSVLMAGTLSC